MTVLTLTLLAALPAAGAAAQAKPVAARPAEVAAPAVVDEQSARDTRDRLREIFEQYPPSVAQVLRLDPSLLTKPDRREAEVPVRYIGFEIPNRFVIGYGLDFAERYRNLPYVGVLDPALIPEGH